MSDLSMANAHLWVLVNGLVDDFWTQKAVLRKGVEQCPDELETFGRLNSSFQ